jgi:hypothetical protein
MKRKSTAQGFVQVLSRLGTGAMIAIVAVLVTIQFWRVFEANYVMSQRLGSIQNDVRTLEARRRSQLRDLQRLNDPQGAIPEIHDRLRLVRPNEAIVFLKPAKPAATPRP